MCRLYLSILEDYDLQHDTQLGKTLDLYLANNKGIQKTAADMFLHKNTINYRINQIKDITNVDFNDNTELLHIGLSYRLKKAKTIQGGWGANIDRLIFRK